MTASDFQLWIKDNPEVWRLFVKFTNQVIRSGHLHYSADAILHRIRWEQDVQTTPNGHAESRPLKLNNNLTSFLARHFHDLYPEHQGFFRTREASQDIVDAAGGYVVTELGNRVLANAKRGTI